MRIFKRASSDQAGMSLVEVLAALTIFSFVTLGVGPLVMGSIKGASLSRSYTVGKNVTQRAMERARGLPYFLSYGTKAEPVDLLDLYFPSASGAVGGRYTTTCAPSASSRACPPGLPAGYAITYEAEFVKPSGVDPAGNETFAVETPPTGYLWNGAANADIPPTQLLRLSVRADWTVLGEPESFQLTSFLGDRSLNEDKVRGIATVDYAVEAIVTLEDTRATNLGELSDLIAVVGNADSRIESRVLSKGEQILRSGDIRLTRTATATLAAQEYDAVVGASSIDRAPTDKNPSPVAAVSDYVTHPDPNIGQVGFLDDTSADITTVAVANELPAAGGTLGVTSEGSGSSNTGFWLDNQALVGSDSPLHLDTIRPIFSVVKSGGVTGITSTSSATTGDVATDRRVQATASLKMGLTRFFPILDFIPNNGHLIRISNLDASVDCKTTGTTAGVALPQYSATLQYWKESDPNDGVTLGDYVPVTLGSSALLDPLDGLFKPASPITGPLSNHPNDSNPMVYEAPEVVPDINGNALDVYLFPVRHEHVVDNTTQPATCVLCHDHDGFLEGWDSQFGLSGTLGPGGLTAVARIDGAIRVTTAPTDPSNPSTGLTTSLGKLTCEAVDRR